ncbi:hypothetical protein PR048_015783 [Dryococelus australis]|uniref:Uncharacterized protein n=1 Tax=Dryococelus australis TaxID=614101 RepID=A0ABQ9HJ03_9NEOP|nr:hypothetical protein PR048_015783 [Dryococelus australis]
MSVYTRQKAKSKYRNRIRLEKASPKKSSNTHKTSYDRVKRCREPKINIIPKWVIEVSMEQHPNERAGGTEDAQENPPINGIVRHDYYMRKSGVTLPGIEPGLRRASTGVQGREETGEPRENALNSGIVRHDSLLRKSGERSLRKANPVHLGWRQEV